MADIEELERRVSALEAANNENTRTLNWLVGTAGRIAADVASLREEVREGRADVSGLRQEFQGFQGSFAGTVADVMREVIKEGKA